MVCGHTACRLQLEKASGRAGRSAARCRGVLCLRAECGDLRRLAAEHVLNPPSKCHGVYQQGRAVVRSPCRLAAERVDVPFLLLDVEASATNRTLAMEKAMTKPQSQRRTAKPVLRGKLHAYHMFFCIPGAYPQCCICTSKAFSPPLRLIEDLAESNRHGLLASIMHPRLSVSSVLAARLPGTPYQTEGLPPTNR